MKRSVTPCKAKDCTNGRRAKSGYCSTHEQRRKNNKPIDAPIRRSRRPDWVDPNDPLTWGVNIVSGYRVRQAMIDGKIRRVQEHRHIWEIHNRPLRPGETIHHKNRIRSDNRIENLELWSKGGQPAGSAVADQVRWAREILAQYGEEYPDV